jgi:hypothetical protein
MTKTSKSKSYHGRSIVHVIDVMMSVSTKVDDTRSPGKRPLLDRTGSNPALVIRIVERGHVVEGLGSDLLQERSANVGQFVELGFELGFLLKLG